MTILLRKLIGDHAEVIEIRQRGLITGIQLAGGLGEQVCLKEREHGLLTRPIRDTVGPMPPLCVEVAELDFAFGALNQVIGDD